jgi:hypothetical protein
LPNRNAERSDPDSTNEVKVNRRCLHTLRANLPTGAAADSPPRILADLMATNDEVERPRDHAGRAADGVCTENLDIVRLARCPTRTARTDC